MTKRERKKQNRLEMGKKTRKMNQKKGLHKKKT